MKTIEFSGIDADNVYNAWLAGRASMLSEACEYVMDRGMATGHADTISELLQHFDEQLREKYTKAGRESMHDAVIEVIMNTPVDECSDEFIELLKGLL